MRHVLFLRVMNLPLIAVLALLTAVVAFHPFYWARLAASSKRDHQVTTVAPWPAHEPRGGQTPHARTAVDSNRARVLDLASEAGVPTLQLTENATVVATPNPDAAVTTDEATTADGKSADGQLTAVDLASLTRAEAWDWVDRAVSRVMESGPLLDRHIARAASQIAGWRSVARPALPQATETVETAAAASAEVNSPDAPASAIRLINPARNQLVVYFLLNGTVTSLQPGQETLVPGPTATVWFDRGGQFGAAQLTVIPGEHQFQVSGRAGWSLTTATANP